MKYFDWDEGKNERLKRERGIGFEDIVIAIIEGEVIVTLAHPKRVNQNIYIVNIDNYAYVVPFVHDKEKYFLKTIYPSRTMTKKYLVKDKHINMPWGRIISMRNKVIHEYSGVDVEILWQTIHEDLPALNGLIKKLV